MAWQLDGKSMCLAALLLFAAPLQAREVLPREAASPAMRETGAPPEASAFDLASLRIKRHERLTGRLLRGPAAAGVPEEAEGPNAVPGTAGSPIAGPSFSYQVGNRGPVIELGMFGGTMKPRQRLAHLALDWDF